MFDRFRRKKKIRRNRSRRSSGHFTLGGETKRGIAIVIIFTIAFFSLLSFFQATGNAGETITTSLGKIFGLADWLFPLLLLVLAYYLIKPGTYTVRVINYIGFAFIILGVTGLLHLTVRDVPLADIIEGGRGGGLLGYAAGNFLYKNTELVGALLILLAILLIGAFIFFNMSFSNLSDLWGKAKNQARGVSFRRKGSEEEEEDEDMNEDEDLEDEEEDEDMNEDEEEDEDAEEPHQEKLIESTPVKRKKAKPKIKIPIDLLLSATDEPSSGDIKANMKKIEETFRSFGIQVTMGEVNTGPTVTQYTLKPTEGVKLNQITSLHSDLALALAAHPIRIEAPIPGKSLVGIEVPNHTKSIVRVRDILESAAYRKRKTNLMLTLGKDVAGKCLMADLGKMPHLLIAGATGSGKSVAINTMITSLVYQNSPDMLQLILVDPKRVELSSYDNIPHLVAPVITEVDKTINALRWAVKQMDDRYKLLQAAGKKNIEAYNDARLMEKMPYIVIIIDELADLMMVAPKEVEAAIIRLAQMARAVGIHLIIATQRPSVNVITGLIKANIPSRIAFSVASLTDSRTILDSSGAEKLLGNGDMLYIGAELSKPRRIQGALITDEEINAVTDFLREHGDPDYDDAVTERKQNLAGGGSGSFEMDEEERDVQEAVRTVVKAKRASATLLQSRMRIGFAKASRILDTLEERGIIGEQNSSKPREVLITEEELKASMADPIETPRVEEYEEEEEMDEEEVEDDEEEEIEEDDEETEDDEEIDEEEDEDRER